MVQPTHNVNNDIHVHSYSTNPSGEGGRNGIISVGVSDKRGEDYTTAIVGIGIMKSPALYVLINIIISVLCVQSEGIYKYLRRSLLGE